MAQAATAHKPQTEQPHIPTAVIPSEAEGSKIPPLATLGRNDGKRKSGWTPERRAKQAARIKIWAPWAKSTGPKTAAGKARSSRNALKTSRPDRAVKAAMRAYGRYLVDLDYYMGLKKRAAQNELLKGKLYNLRRRLLRTGQKVTTNLNAALLYAKLYGKIRSGPAFADAWRVGIVL